MQQVCNDAKDAKHLGKQSNTILQLYRAYIRYPDCDKKRVEPCKETEKTPEKRKIYYFM